jgi:hypothetical protein
MRIEIKEIEWEFAVDMVDGKLVLTEVKETNPE